MNNIIEHWYSITATSNYRHSMSNYRPIECLLNTFFGLATKKHQRFLLLSLCEWIRAQRGSATRNMFPYEDLTIMCAVCHVWTLQTIAKRQNHPSGINNTSYAWASCQIGQLAGAHALGMLGTISPPPRVSDPDMHHGTCQARLVMHVGIAN